MKDLPRPFRWFLILLALALVLAAIYWGWPWLSLFSDQDALRSWVASFGAWGPLVIISLHLAQVLAAPIPGQAVDAASGYLFGVGLGTLYSVIGAGGSSLIAFALARRFGRPLVERLVSPQALDRLDDLGQRRGPALFFLIWLFPLSPDDMACYAAGLTPMPWRQMVVLVLLGRLPGLFTANWVGANAARLSPGMWVALILGVAALGLGFWRWGEQLEIRVLDLLGRLVDRFRSR
jgi:uncharacterized membrane protein YdjX (TVP38/TMEM64 family)